MDAISVGFILFCSALVLLMTPGLAFFYGGLADHRNVLGIKMQNFLSVGVSTLLWWAVGYSLCFSGEGGFIGNLDKAFLSGVSLQDIYPGTGLPVFVFFVFQMMFAIITPALITGAFINRVSFKAYLIFLILWQFCVYYPFVHMVWGGGWLAQWGVLDFAGGIVVHISAGMAALATAIYVGKRKHGHSQPHNVPTIALGTALLWFGWFGFNAGSALEVGDIAVLAFVNTQIAAAMGATVWMLLDWKLSGKPKFVGFLTGVIAGLATVTPAAGFIATTHAALLGCVGSVLCYFAVMLANRFQWDDALDVWAVHGVGGIVGTIGLGLFASLVWNAAGVDGLVYGGADFFVKQVVAVLATAAYAYVITLLMLKLINVLTPVRVSDDIEDSGLDSSLHGEQAYDHANEGQQRK